MRAAAAIVLDRLIHEDTVEVGGIKMDQYIRSLENEHLRDDLPKMGLGDTVRVS